MYADRKAPYPETITAPLISLRSRCHWSRFHYAVVYGPTVKLGRGKFVVAFFPFARKLTFFPPNTSVLVKSPRSPYHNVADHFSFPRRFPLSNCQRIADTPYILAINLIDCSSVDSLRVRKKKRLKITASRWKIMRRFNGNRERRACR